jgi:hypothetical protein
MVVMEPRPNEQSSEKTLSLSVRDTLIAAGVLLTIAAGTFFILVDDDDDRSAIRSLTEASNELDRLREESRLELARVTKDAEASQKQLRELHVAFVKNAIALHESKIRNAQSQLEKDIAGYFDTKREWTPYFAEAADTWSNDFDAAFRSETYAKNLRLLFHKHVISPEQMTSDIPGFIRRYLDAVAISERELFSSVKLHMNEHRSTDQEIELDEEAFRSLIDTRIAELADDVTFASRVQYGVQITGVLLNLLTAGQSGKLGKISHEITKNVPIKLERHLVARLVHRIEGLAEQFDIDEDKLESSALLLLDELTEVLMNGSEQARAELLAEELKLAAISDEMERSRLLQDLDRRRASGHFGLNTLLDAARARNIEAKSLVLSELVNQP